MNRDHYSILLQRIKPEDGNGWLATIPELPGCMTDGETIIEAISNLQNAKCLWLETAQKRNQKIPEPKYVE